MTQQEKYSLHLAYEPQIICVNTGSIGYLNGLSNSGVYTQGKWYGINNFKPYLRNLSDLTKPITQKDYNDGKPFVPVEELQKQLLNVNMYFGTFSEFEWIGFSDFKNSHIPIIFLDEISSECPLWIVQYLLKWHFAIGFEQGEYIEVTEENKVY